MRIPLQNRPLFIHAVNILFVTANYVGSCVYAYVSASAWEPLVWLAFGLPFLLGFLLLNLTWARLVLRFRQRQSVILWAFVAMIWFITLKADYSRY